MSVMDLQSVSSSAPYLSDDDLETLILGIMDHLVTKVDLTPEAVEAIRQIRQDSAILSAFQFRLDLSQKQGLTSPRVNAMILEVVNKVDRS